MDATARPVAVQSEYTRGFIPYGVRNGLFLPSRPRRTLAAAPLKLLDVASVAVLSLAPPWLLESPGTVAVVCAAGAAADVAGRRGAPSSNKSMKLR